MAQMTVSNSNGRAKTRSTKWVDGPAAVEGPDDKCLKMNNVLTDKASVTNAKGPDSTGDSASDATAGTEDAYVDDDPVTQSVPAVHSGNDAQASGAKTAMSSSKKTQGNTLRPRLIVGPSYQHVVTLPRAAEICYCYGEPEPQAVTPFGLEFEYKGNIDRARDSRKVVHAKDNSNATFFTVGLVTESTLINGGKAKEINIKPLAWLWPRCQAVISQLLKFNNVVVTSYKDGVQFSTMRKPAEGRRELKVKSVSMDGRTHGPLVCAWDIEVPCFIGTDPFKLTEYMKLEPSYADFDPGDCVLVAFTIGGYRTAKTESAPSLNRASLNIQFAILLASANTDDAGPSVDTFPRDLADETALGVDDPTPMNIPDGEGIDWAASDIEIPDGPEF
ncbi:uncharacterized protein ARMOST_17379 [Armillaria ostoyae]|uniref:Uncharacterized protein n=1 Tax=Armillaria ostoyae TaxID=47428 RepID=A0A284RYT6_ARMOS|nr:uncharacterized protein ARMOST_17379 [Armillaria ostoyae]